MENNAKSLFSLVVAALVLGVAGDILFQDAALGINAVAGLTLLVAAITLLQRRMEVRVPGRYRWLALPTILAAGGFALRDSPTLAALSGIVLAACLLLGAHGSHAPQYSEPGILASLRAMMGAGRGILGGSVRFVRHDVPRVMHPGPAQKSQHGRAAGRGVLLTIPLLLVFGSLLSAADPVFAHYLAALFQWDLAAFWEHCGWIVVGFCLVGGFLRFLLQTQTDEEQREEAAPRVSIGRVETAIVLGALDTLFFLFVLVQFRYFFGGRETVLATVGMTYAAYARHGFFELVTVAGLTLPLLLTLHAWQERPAPSPDTGQTPAQETLFRGLAGLLLLLLFVIMASALARMNLYRSEYGLTELRVYTTAFMGWLAVVFVWLGLTVLRGRRQHFAGGAGVWAFAALALLLVWNPDMRIVRANAALSQSGRHFDADYATSLSADAVPELIADLVRLSPADRQAVATRLLQRRPAARAADWRSWCWGRWAAERCLARSHARLVALSGPAPQVPARPQTRTVTMIVPAVPR